MGMYTELHFNAQLKRDTPKQVIDTLAYMNWQVQDEPSILPKHELFGKSRWDFMLRCSSSYFALSPASSVDWDEDSRCYYLHVRCNLKNYNDEIESFLDWIMPYIDSGGECLGYYRYEEENDPTLIYKK